MTEDDADPLYGRCDTCGARCDREGCTFNRDHEVALDPLEEEPRERFICFIPSCRFLTTKADRAEALAEYDEHMRRHARHEERVRREGP